MNLNDFKISGREHYERFCECIAKVLSEAIKADGTYRLLQVTYRAKEIGSLRRKLLGRDIPETADLAEEIKDLAGCRIIFYTNDDVSKFVNSGIIYDLFEIAETKIHHPQRGAEDATGLYRSNHFVVQMKDDMLAQQDFSEFAEMRCEVQVQTILNHAWAAMAHDTIYKAPDISDFGTKQLAEIEERLRKVSEKYLVPAGYEFQKIVRDFDQLMIGKKAFDDDLLSQIVDAPDNNIRADLVEQFSSHVLPHYDNMQSVFPEIVEKLLQSEAWSTCK